IDSPLSWRLVNQAKGDDEEVVFTIPGVVKAKALPPILFNPPPRNKCQFLQQNITLTGLGTSSFQESKTALNEMHAVFSRQFPEGRVSFWNAGGPDIILSNRLFTSVMEAGQLESVPFGENVDPKGILADMLGGALIHTEDNQVRYYQRLIHLTHHRYLPASPQIFRIGDIVEAQFSLVVYKMKGENYVLKPMLYSIALLDASSNSVATRRVVLKRKIGYKTQEETDVQ
ncbi:hypothetical protein BDN72DRAFT_735144, partial [Pluteus cervinus]